MPAGNILDWSSKQGRILVGGGLLNERQKPGRDFSEEELPHYLLRRGLCREVFLRWRGNDERGCITGAWKRPLFAGGWDESTELDTLAFNIQSPSLFVDLRIPVERPGHLAMKKGLEDCSLEDLRFLSRQHCFSGYSFPSEGWVYTRHHAIDWNYHPSFPRPRPNKWRAEMNASNKMSFKEYSTTLDTHQVPVYMERWQRFEGDSMGKKYFAAMCLTGAPGCERQSIFVIVGNHFACARDRPFYPDFYRAHGPGGPALVDHAVIVGNRESAEVYLDLEGSYGMVFNNSSSKKWTIMKCTHPWLEKRQLISERDNSFYLKLSDRRLSNDDIPRPDMLSLSWEGQQWDVLENSFSCAELHDMFGITSALKSRL